MSAWVWAVQVWGKASKASKASKANMATREGIREKVDDRIMSFVRVVVRPKKFEDKACFFF